MKKSMVPEITWMLEILNNNYISNLIELSRCLKSIYWTSLFSIYHFMKRLKVTALSTIEGMLSIWIVKKAPHMILFLRYSWINMLMTDLWLNNSNDAIYIERFFHWPFNNNWCVNRKIDVGNHQYDAIPN